MEEINFINTQDLKQNYRLKKYVRLSIILAILTFIILTIITIMQKNKLYAIKENIKKSESKNLQINTSSSKSGAPNKPGALGTLGTSGKLGTINALDTSGENLDQKTKLKNEKIELKKQLELVNNLKKTPKKEINILLNIYKTIPKQAGQIDLQTLSVNKSEFVILAESPDDKIAGKITKKLSKLQYIKTASLASMQKNNKFSFQIKGKIKV